MTTEITSNPGAGGYEFPVDVVGGYNYTKSKLVSGADGTATDVTPTSGLPVLQSGSVGVDHSANQPAFPPGGLALLITISANASRNSVGVQNQDTPELQLWRDDGAGNNLTLLLLDGAASAGQQGGAWYSQTFKGRLRIYGTTGKQVAAYED